MFLIKRWEKDSYLKGYTSNWWRSGYITASHGVEPEEAIDHTLSLFYIYIFPSLSVSRSHARTHNIYLFQKEFFFLVLYRRNSGLYGDVLKEPKRYMYRQAERERERVMGEELFSWIICSIRHMAKWIDEVRSRKGSVCSLICFSSFSACVRWNYYSIRLHGFVIYSRLHDTAHTHTRKFHFCPPAPLIVTKSFRFETLFF